MAFPFLFSSRKFIAQNIFDKIEHLCYISVI